MHVPVNMAAPPGSVGTVEGELQNSQDSYHFMNGEDKETAILSGDEPVDSLPSLESMLQAATDLQYESPDPRRIGGHLELSHEPAAPNYSPSGMESSWEASIIFLKIGVVDA